MGTHGTAHATSDAPVWHHYHVVTFTFDVGEVAANSSHGTSFLAGIASITFGEIPMWYEVRPGKSVGVEVFNKRPKDLTAITAAKAES